MNLINEFVMWWVAVAGGLVSSRIYDDLVVKPSLPPPSLQGGWIRRRREEELLNGHPLLYPESIQG